jgi:hypothetical protein
MEQEEFIVKEEIFYNTEVKVFGNNMDIPNLYKVLSGFERKTFGAYMELFARHYGVDCKGDKGWSGMMSALELDDSGTSLSLFLCSRDIPKGFFELVEKKFSTCSVLYYTCDSTNEVYITNDKDALVFTQRFVLEINNDKYQYETMYFDFWDEVVTFFDSELKENINDLDSVKTYDEKLRDISDEYYCAVHEVMEV